MKRCVVIGAGVVGLAIARSFAHKGWEVVVLEKEKRHGMGISSRNSEVIHAGIYYPPGSLKARFCVEGKHLLYEYLKKYHLPFRVCGKLIVATTPAEHDQLEALRTTAVANGVGDLEYVDVANYEPCVHATAALLSPSTGIFSVHDFMNTLEADLIAAGAIVATHMTYVAGEAGWKLTVRDDEGAMDVIEADVVVNAAGLFADEVAATVMTVPEPAQLTWVKGNYFSLRRLRFERLVYPVPHDERHLGTHVTIDLDGNARLGPDVEPIQRVENYDVDPARRTQFFEAARQFLPTIRPDDIEPAYSGIRPFTHRRQGFKDWYIAQDMPGWFNLIGMNSPGLTAALALGDHIASLT